jgi:hypothetical protein
MKVEDNPDTRERDSDLGVFAAERATTSADRLARDMLEVDQDKKVFGRRVECVEQESGVASALHHVGRRHGRAGPTLSLLLLLNCDGTRFPPIHEKSKEKQVATSERYKHK